MYMVLLLRIYYLNNVILYVVALNKKYSVKNYVAVSLFKRSTQFSTFFV